MKFVALIIAAIAIVPLSTKMAQDWKWHRAVWFLIGFFCFGVTLSADFAMALMAWPMWAGHVKGLEITVTDVLVAAAALSMWNWKPAPSEKLKFPLKWQAWAWLLAVLVSLFVSQLFTASLFYFWQTVRIVFVTYVVWKACIRDEKVAGYLFTGLGVGLCYEAGLVVTQRFLYGVVQASGTFGHQNLLGMVIHFVLPPFVMMILSRKTGMFEKVVVLAALIAASFTASRATIGLTAAGFVLTVALSLYYQRTPQKLKAFMIIFLVGALATPLAMRSLATRFDYSPIMEEEYDERAVFIKASKMMAERYPLGTGPNTYVVIANTGGFYAAAGVAPSPNSRSAHVHNIYWLTFVEMSWYGLAAFLWWQATIILKVFRAGFRSSDPVRGELLIGIGVSFLVAAIHSWYEWIYILGVVQYFAAVSAGIGLALARAAAPAVVKPQANFQHQPGIRALKG